MSFVRWTQGFAGNSGFEEAVDRIIEAFKELSNNPEYNSKVAKVLNYMIIKEKKKKKIDFNFYILKLYFYSLK